nr:DUF1778 domain-containing protein [Martelella alba]
MLEATQAAVEESLIVRRIIMSDPEAYKKFLTHLDRTPAPNAELCKIMQTPVSWEQKK